MVLSDYGGFFFWMNVVGVTYVTFLYDICDGL